jgi:hypothetical protein
MTFNRLETDREDIGDFLVSVPFGNEFDDAFLARRKNVIGDSAAFSQKRSKQRLRHSRGPSWRRSAFSLQPIARIGSFSSFRCSGARSGARPYGPCADRRAVGARSRLLEDTLAASTSFTGLTRRPGPAAAGIGMTEEQQAKLSRNLPRPIP